MYRYSECPVELTAAPNSTLKTDLINKNRLNASWRWIQTNMIPKHDLSVREPACLSFSLLSTYITLRSCNSAWYFHFQYEWRILTLSFSWIKTYHTAINSEFLNTPDQSLAQEQNIVWCFRIIFCGKTHPSIRWTISTVLWTSDWPHWSLICVLWTSERMVHDPCKDSNAEHSLPINLMLNAPPPQDF